MVLTDGEGQIRRIDNLGDRALHIRDDSVSDHQQNPVDLLLNRILASNGGHLLDDLFQTK